MTLAHALSRWFPYNQPDHTHHARLFCFPYGGGNVVFYRKWQELLPDSTQVYPVQLPGRGMRIEEPSHRTLTTLVNALVEVFEPFLASPYYLFGHSMGALIAFELANQLQKRFQSSPKHMIVSGFRAPHLPNPKAPIHLLPDQQFVESVAEMNGIPEEILRSPEYLAFFLPQLRADFQLCETYQYQKEAPLQSPITAFGGIQDPEVSKEMLQSWKMHTRSHFELVLFSGDHFFIHHDEEAVTKTIASIIKDDETVFPKDTKDSHL